MRSVSVADAKARFSELVQAAEAGETVSRLSTMYIDPERLS